MLGLTKGNIRIITETIDKAGISFSHLREDLIDHICCEVESEMENGTDFQKAFAKIKRSFGLKNLQKVQEQTLLLIDKNYCTMKKTMKISGILSTSLLMIGSLLKIFHWPFAGICLILGFFILCFFFLPSANYILHRENKDKSMIILFISAFLGSFGFFLGLLFKIQHWPGANILLFTGICILAILFLPVLLIYSNRNSKDTSGKVINSIGIISGIIYLFGLLAKFMVWPGAQIGLTIGSLIIVLIFVPAYTVKKYKNEKYIKGSFLYLIAAISWFILFSTLMSINISRSVISNFIEENITLERSVYMLKYQNNRIIQDAKNKLQYNKIQEVDNLTALLNKNIEIIKTEIAKTMGAENSGSSVSKGYDVRNLSNYTEMGGPYYILIGEKNDGKAYALKSEIDDLRNQLITYCEQDKNISMIINHLLTTSVSNGNPQGLGWEQFYFGHISGIGCLNNLTSLQRNVFLAENEVINFLSKSKYID